MCCWVQWRWTDWGASQGNWFSDWRIHQWEGWYHAAQCLSSEPYFTASLRPSFSIRCQASATFFNFIFWCHWIWLISSEAQCQPLKTMNWAILLYCRTCSLVINRGQKWNFPMHSKPSVVFPTDLRRATILVYNKFLSKLICPPCCNFICKDLRGSHGVLIFIVHNPFLRFSGSHYCN